MDSFYRALITSVQKDPVGLTQSPPFLCILAIFIELLVSFFYIKLIKSLLAFLSGLLLPISSLSPSSGSSFHGYSA